MGKKFNDTGLLSLDHKRKAVAYECKGMKGIPGDQVSRNTISIWIQVILGKNPRTQAYSQWIVTARPLCHLQHLVHLRSSTRDFAPGYDLFCSSSKQSRPPFRKMTTT